MNENERSDALSVFPENIKRMLCGFPEFNMISEIRLRLNGALCVTGSFGICFLRETGYSYASDENAYSVTRRDIEQVIEKSCGYCVYAHEDELRRGFITYGNGHRIGLSGDIGADNMGIAFVSSLCVRIARDYPHAADELLESLYKDRLPGVLTVGSPGSGKTTILKAAAKALAQGKTGRAYRVAVIDERYELAGRALAARCSGGCADIISGCSKSEGILRAVRLLSPELIVCDEIGSLEEAECIASVLGCGVKFLASIHASSIEQLRRSRRFEVLLQTGVFDYAVLLKSQHTPGKIGNIYDLREKTDEIYSGGRALRGSVYMGLV